MTTTTTPCPDSGLSDLVVMLRVLIGDCDETDYDYTDVKLQQLLLTSTKLVLAEVSISRSYVLTICNASTGDFSVAPTLSDDLTALIITKAACVLLNAELRYKASIEGFSASCGRASMSSNGRSNAWEILMGTGPCQTYITMKDAIERAPGLTGASFRAIMSPFVNSRINGSHHCGGHGNCNY